MTAVTYSLSMIILIVLVVVTLLFYLGVFAWVPGVFGREKPTVHARIYSL